MNIGDIAIAGVLVLGSFLIGYQRGRAWNQEQLDAAKQYVKSMGRETVVVTTRALVEHLRALIPRDPLVNLAVPASAIRRELDEMLERAEAVAKDES